jgi:hypothetical protein
MPEVLGLGLPAVGEIGRAPARVYGRSQLTRARKQIDEVALPGWWYPGEAVRNLIARLLEDRQPRSNCVERSYICDVELNAAAPYSCILGE